MNRPAFALDAAGGRVIFQGDCLERLHACGARCCRHWPIFLSEEERLSGGYESRDLCRLTGGDCSRPGRPCVHRRSRMGTRRDGSCVYLTDGRCGIYDRRPAVCREFRCTETRDSGSPSVDRPMDAMEIDSPVSTRKPEAPPNGNAVFIVNPRFRVTAAFCLRRRGEIAFVLEADGACGRMHVRAPADCGRLDDAGVCGLIRLFDGREPLAAVYRRFRSETGVPMTDAELDSVVGALTRSHILIAAGSTPGLPPGTEETGGPNRSNVKG